MTTRVSPPANKTLGPNPITVYGRTYSCAVGATLDVADQDAAQMVLNGWHSSGLVMTTANRPAIAYGANPLFPKGTYMIDSTLNAVIMYDGTQWRNVLTGAVV